MDPSRKFTTHFVSARFEDLSAEVVEAVKMTVLDTAGAALAGSSSAAGRGIARIAQRYGGGTGSTLLAHGGRVAAPMAALANGVMARCCELDGTHESGGGHVGVCMVPAALALAEGAPTPVDGRELTLGIALGVDMPFVKGHPTNPFTLGDCVERFMTAAAAAVRPLARERLERFVSMVENLEGVTDTAEMAPLLA